MNSSFDRFKEFQIPTAPSLYIFKVILHVEEQKFIQAQNQEHFTRKHGEISLILMWQFLQH